MRLKSEQIKDDEKRLRGLMREKFGAGKYRITSNGEVHAYGRAPNSIEVCWWLFGLDIEEALFWLNPLPTVDHEAVVDYWDSVK